MATIDDYGKAADDTLAAPPLGGPDGWAAAVAAELTRLGGAIRGGNVRVTTDAAGKFAIPHGLGRIPGWFLMQAALGNAVQFAASPGTDAAAPNGTNLYGFAFNPDGQPLVSAPVHISWVAGL
jgi:hypothetical protein